jgi:hypothetical protein
MRINNSLSLKKLMRHVVLALLFGCFMFMSLTHAEKSQFTCRDWMALERPSKIAIISLVIKMSKEDHIEINQSPMYYVAELDDLIKVYMETKNEEALDSSVGVTFHTIAAMDGDWGKGEPKLEHARSWMGEWFEVFKTRFPEKHAKLVSESEKE